MTFTYDPTTSTGLVRLYIGDTIKDLGPRPNGSNFSDEEISVIVAQTSETINAVVELLTILANEWAHVADQEIGPRREYYSQNARAFSQRAEKEASRANVSSTSYSFRFKKVDGYVTDET